MHGGHVSSVRVGRNVLRFGGKGTDRRSLSVWHIRANSGWLVVALNMTLNVLLGVSLIWNGGISRIDGNSVRLAIDN